jgi:hypothetical protein
MTLPAAFSDCQSQNNNSSWRCRRSDEIGGSAEIRSALTQLLSALRRFQKLRASSSQSRLISSLIFPVVARLESSLRAASILPRLHDDPDSAEVQ